MKKNPEDEGYTPLWRRITEVMREMDWSEADLRRELDIGPQDVYNYKYRNAVMDQERAIRLQAKTKFFAEWVNYGRGAKRVYELSKLEQQVVDKLREDSSKLDAIAALLGLRT